MPQSSAGLRCKICCYDLMVSSPGDKTFTPIDASLVQILMMLLVQRKGLKLLMTVGLILPLRRKI